MSAAAGYFAWETTGLSKAALNYYRAHGYVILTRHATAAQCAALRSEAGDIVADFFSSSSIEDVPVFKTSDTAECVHGQYLLDSSAKVSCFLEEQDKTKVNKIGHALHEILPSFRDFSSSPSVRSIAKSCAIEKPVCIQSMYILKNARVGGEVVAHRDATFVRSKADTGASVLGFWWALEDSTLENGCLWAVPGSHLEPVGLKFGTIPPHASDISSNALTEMNGEELHAKDPAEYVPLPMKQGDVILLHGSVLHMSKANTSQKSRHAYSIHVVSEGVNERCWIQRPDSMPFMRL